MAFGGDTRWHGDILEAVPDEVREKAEAKFWGDPSYARCKAVLIVRSRSWSALCSQVSHWCREQGMHNKAQYGFAVRHRGRRYQVQALGFEIEKDAVAFKLRWL